MREGNGAYLEAHRGELTPRGAGPDFGGTVCELGGESQQVAKPEASQCPHHE
jgi:hypothetical protein